MSLINREETYKVLTDYYHHTTETQHSGLREALGRVPSADYIEQIKWERDTAIRQLKDLGYSLGEKPRKGDLIRKDDVLAEVMYWYGIDASEILDRLVSVELPSAERTGEWIWVQYDSNPELGNFHCSECNFIPACFNLARKHLNFCPNCGCRMKGEEDVSESY